MIEDIETAFVNAAKAIDGIQDALPYEPEGLPPLPCVTMLLVRTAQEDYSTGLQTEGTWQWRVTLYLELRDYKQAQARMKELIPFLLRITRVDPTLGFTCEKASITDAGIPPTFDHQGGKLIKPLTLTAITTLAD